MINWTKYFDAIYCLHYLPNKERGKTIQAELDRIGIGSSGILHYKYTYPSPFDKVLLKSLPYNKKFVLQHVLPRAINAGMGYYSIYQEALGLEYNKVLVIEDDVAFLKDLNELEDILNHIPEEWDFLRFDKTNNSQCAHMLKTLVRGPYFSGNYTGGYWALGASAVSAKAMKIGIKSMEKELFVVDQIFENRIDPELNTLKRYISNLSLVRQIGSKYDQAYAGLSEKEKYNM